MPVQISVSYPLDPTGISPLNLVQGEVHALVNNRHIDAIATKYGAFFASSLVVRDQETSRILMVDVDYFACELFELPTALYSQDICGVIVILDSTVNTVLIDYQALGEKYGQPSVEVANSLRSLDLLNRPNDWPYPAINHNVIPVSQRLYDQGIVFGFEYAVQALYRIANAIEHGDRLSHDAIFNYLEQRVGGSTPALLDEIQRLIDIGLAAHIAQPDPHPQYLKKSDNAETAAVRKPSIISPASNAINVSDDVTFISSTYGALYRIPQVAAQFQLSLNPGCVAPFVFDTTLGAVVSYHYTTLLLSNTKYYWRVRHQNNEGSWSVWSDVVNFTTMPIGIDVPVITSPTNNQVGIGETPNLTASTFSTYGATDTHVSSDWEVWTGANGTGSLVHASLGDTVNKTSLPIPSGKLVVNTTYYPRVRYRGVNLGVTDYSAVSTFTTASSFFPSVIGETYGGGFFMGNVVLSDGTYAVILAPKATGETNKAIGSSNSSLVNALSLIDSVTNTSVLASTFNNVTYGAAWVRSLNISGFTDWQIPARTILQQVMSHAKSSTTTLFSFKTGGVEELTGTRWSSTCYEWVEETTTTYNYPDTPIYGTVTKDYTGSGAPTNDPHCGVDGNGEGGYSYVPGTYSENGSGQAFWLCRKESTEIIGYEVGGTYEETTYTNRHQAFAFNSAGTYSNYNKTSSYFVRAIRLIKVS
jgi:hypothetical protein